MATNNFNNVEPKEPKPSYAIMPTSTSPSPSLPKSSIQSQHAPLSLEVASCQEDSKNHKEKNIKKDQDQEPSMSSNYFHNVSDPFHGPFDPPCLSSFIPPCLKSSPKKDQATTYTVEPIENQEKNSMLMLSKDPCQDQSLPSSCSTTPCLLPLSTLPKSS